MTTKINNIGLVALYDDPRVAQTVLTLGQHLLAQQLGVVLTDDLQTPKGLDNVSTVPPEQLGEQCDLVIAVGGDGTMLHAARLVAEHSVPLVGINRGQLGFLADVRPSVMTEKIDAILAGQYIAEDRMMVRAELTKKDKSATMFGLNDVVIKRIDTARMLEFDIFLNGKFLNSQAGDGLIIATPTGSTAYALASGGPIIETSLSNLVLAPICPHTLSERPLVIDAMCEVTIKLRRRAGTLAAVACDGDRIDLFGTDDQLTATQSARRVTLWHPTDYDFFATLREKLSWGLGSAHSETRTPSESQTH